MIRYATKNTEIDPALTNSPEILEVEIIKNFRSGELVSIENQARKAKMKSVTATTKTFLGLERFLR
jgi:hypothetical protein